MSNYNIFIFVYAAPSAAPYGLVLSAPNSRSIYVTWNAYQIEDWNGDRGGFKINIIDIESGKVRNFTIPNSDATNTVVYSLHPYYTYNCRIAAYNARGTGPYAQGYIQLPEDGQCFIRN